MEGKNMCENKSIQGMNRDVIKYIAMATMLMNHISAVFMEPGTWMAEFFQDVGYFTAPVMCWFLVEGYRYTHSKKKYALRLLLFAVLSELPFCLAFSYETVLSFCGLNMLFTLFFCFLILEAKEKISRPFLRVSVYVVLVFVTAICDWPFMAAIYTIMFACTYGSKRKTAISYGAAVLIFMAFMYYSRGMLYPGWQGIVRTVFAGMGVAASGIVILCFYNGKRATHGRIFSKWFFYVFYPVHLLILGMIRVVVEVL